MGATYSKKEKKNRVYYRFVKPWRHEGSSNNSDIGLSDEFNEELTLYEVDTYRGDIWHRRRVSDESYRTHQSLTEKENVVLCKETVFDSNARFYDSINESEMDISDEETQSTRRSWSRLPTPDKTTFSISKQESVKDESKATGDSREQISSNIQIPEALSIPGGSEEMFYKSDAQSVSEDDLYRVNTIVDTIAPHQFELSETQVGVKITDTEEEQEDADDEEEEEQEKEDDDDEEEEEANDDNDGDDEEEEKASPLPIRTRVQRHRYEETIILYRPMIVRDVIVDQILPHLHMFLSSSDVNAIKGETDQHKAVQVLLDILSVCKEPGKWKLFVQVLENCGYQAIVDALKRRSVPDNDEPKQILKMFLPELRETIKPSEITAELLEADVINNDDKNEIHQKEHTSGDSAAADILFDRIPRKHPNWFEKFLGVLTSIGQHDLVDKLSLQTVRDVSPATEGNPVQSDKTNEPTKYDINTERTDLEYSKPYEDAYGFNNKQEHSNDDETLEKKAMIEADRNLQISKKKIKYTRVVIDGQVCTFTDENATEERCSPVNKEPESGTNLESFLPSCILPPEVQSLREKKNALVTEGNQLELEMMEYKEILKAHEKNNELLNRKRSFREQIKMKEKEAAALKAAISDKDIEEDKFRYQSATSLEDMVEYIAPGRRSITWDFRDTDATTTVIPSRIPFETGITMPVKLYDVEQIYKDSAFYSEC